jgi:WD40 repeat protein
MNQHPKIQKAADGTLLLNFGQYGRAVEVAAISGSGQRVLTVREVGLAEVWDALSGRPVGEIRPDSPLHGTTGTAPMAGAFHVFIESAALNHDGSAALLGLNDGTAGIFRVSDGVRLATFQRPDKQPATDWSVIRAVAFSPDGSYALVGFSGRSAGVWSAKGYQLVAFLEAPDGDKLVRRPFVRDTLVSSIAMSPDNRWLFAGNADMTATIWEVTTGQTMLSATEHAEDTLAVFDTAAGFGWVTTGGSVWRSPRDEAPEKVLSSGELWQEAYVDGTTLLTRGFGGEAKRWDLVGGTSALLSSSQCLELMWHRRTVGLEGGWVYYVEGAQRLTVRREAEQFIAEGNERLAAARFAPPGSAFATHNCDGVKLWSVPGGELIRIFPPRHVGDFAFSPDGRFIAIGETGWGGGLYTRQVYVYDTATGRQQSSHGEHQWQVSQVEFSPDGTCVASLADEIVVWDVNRRQVRERIAADRAETEFRFLRDGRLLVVGPGSVRIFGAGEMILEWVVPVAYRPKWCVSHDDRTLTMALKQGVIRFDLETGASRGTWEAPILRHDLVPTVSLATELDARAWVALWRTEYGTFVHYTDGPRGWVQPLHLSSEGCVVVPSAAGATVIHIGGELSVVGHVPFEGTLRASRIVDDEVLLVNEHGQLFRHRPQA